MYVTGEEGPSLMGLEDMAMFRALPTTTIFYPSDGVSTEKAVELAATTKVLKVLSSINFQLSYQHIYCKITDSLLKCPQQSLSYYAFPL